MLSFTIDLVCPYLRAFAHTVPAGLLFSQTSARLTPSLHSSLCSKFTFRDRLSLRPYLKEQCSPPLPLSVTFFSLTLLYSVSFISYHLTVKKYVVLPIQIHVYSTHMNLFIVYPLARVYTPWEQKLFLLYSQYLDWCPAHSMDSKNICWMNEQIFTDFLLCAKAPEGLGYEWPRSLLSRSSSSGGGQTQEPRATLPSRRLD